MTQVGTGKYTYEVIRDFPKLPAGESFGVISRVATDSQDRLYVFQRKDPPVMVFGRDGKYLGCWGIGAVKEAHGMKIVDDVVYTTDRTDSVAVAFTLDGKPLLVLGKRGVHSDTGCGKSPYIVLRAAGPFNHPTEMMPHPNGDIYVTDGYRNCRVHRFTRDGQLVKSWGTPGKTEGAFHLPHSLAIDPDGKPKVHDPALNHVGLWVDDLAAAVAWLEGQGVRFTPGGIRKGEAGYDVCIIHPKGGGEFPLGGEGVLIELVQAPREVIEALAAVRA